MSFKVGDIVVMSNMPGHVYMIGEIHSSKFSGGIAVVPDFAEPTTDMNRYDCQEDGPDGAIYYNMPGYLMRLATEEEIDVHRKAYSP